MPRAEIETSRNKNGAVNIRPVEKRALIDISSNHIEKIKDFREIPITILMLAGTPWTTTEYEIVCEQEEPILFGKLRITFARISKPSPATAGPQREPVKQV